MPANGGRIVEKKLPSSIELQRQLIEPDDSLLSLCRQCELLGLNWLTWYFQLAEESLENLRWMRMVDEQYLLRPYYGSRRMTTWLCEQGDVINRKRVRRLMRIMGLESICPQPRTTQRCPEHRVFPYLLRNVEIVRPDHVWSTDITYVPMPRGFMYLSYVLAWQLSNSLEGTFCVEVLEAALGLGRPEIFNTDQGVQYTAANFIARLEQAGVAISNTRKRVPGSRSGIRQRVHRATVAERDVRMFVSAGLRDGGAAGAGLGRVFHVLQPRAAAPRISESFAGRSVLRASKKPMKSWALELLSRQGDQIYLQLLRAW